jgi:hypothetical protein
MKLHEFTQLAEARNADYDYEDFDDRVILRLTGVDSQIVTKMAQTFKEIEAQEEQLKILKDAHKQQIRELADLFDSVDIAKTRVIETKSLVVQISKNPEPTKAPKYKDILEAIATKLGPELLAVLNKLKETMVTITQKQPGVKVKSLDEGTLNSLRSFFAQVKAKVVNWANNYDQKLLMLKNAIARA